MFSVGKFTRVKVCRLFLNFRIIVLFNSSTFSISPPLLSIDNAVLLWKLSESLATGTGNMDGNEEEENKETWTVFKVLRYV